MLSRFLTVSLAALTVIPGCAREAMPVVSGACTARGPATVPPSELPGKQETGLDAWSPESLEAPEQASVASPIADSASEPAPSKERLPPAQVSVESADRACPEAHGARDWGPRIEGSDVPGGATCLAALDELGIRYGKFDHDGKLLVLKSDLGGIRYRGLGGVSLVGDCRLMLALHRVGPTLLRAGVTEVQYSGGYSYRMSRTGRLSLHAYGLAIDVHGFVVDGRTVLVERDFQRGLKTCPCAAQPPINRVACALRTVHLFRELLTPDYDADHRNHFHWGIAPLDSEKPVQVALRSKTLPVRRGSVAASQPVTTPGLGASGTPISAAGDQALPPLRPGIRRAPPSVPDADREATSPPGDRHPSAAARPPNPASLRGRARAAAPAADSANRKTPSADAAAEATGVSPGPPIQQATQAGKSATLQTRKTSARKQPAAAPPGTVARALPEHASAGPPPDDSSAALPPSAVDAGPSPANPAPPAASRQPAARSSPPHPPKLRAARRPAKTPPSKDLAELAQQLTRLERAAVTAPEPLRRAHTASRPPTPHRTTPSRKPADAHAAVPSRPEPQTEVDTGGWVDQ